MSTRPTLGYWAARGTVQPIRYLLKYAGVDFNDKRYDLDNRDSWFSVKTNLGLEFPNLPYYTDGDINLTQSVAILRYLGRKHGLVARDDTTRAKQDLVEQYLDEILVKFVMNTALKDDYDTNKAEYCTAIIEPMLNQLANFLGDKEWLTGSISYVDFMGYVMIDIMRQYTPQTMAKYPTLEKYLERFESLPAIKAYLSSTQYKKWPLFGPQAKWGAK